MFPEAGGVAEGMLRHLKQIYSIATVLDPIEIKLSTCCHLIRWVPASSGESNNRCYRGNFYLGVPETWLPTERAHVAGVRGGVEPSLREHEANKASISLDRCCERGLDQPQTVFDPV